MPHIRAQLEAALGTTHTIERELGGGGMSRVFLAGLSDIRRDIACDHIAGIRERAIRSAPARGGRRAAPTVSA